MKIKNPQNIEIHAKSILNSFEDVKEIKISDKRLLLEFRKGEVLYFDTSHAGALFLFKSMRAFFDFFFSEIKK